MPIPTYQQDDQPQALPTPYSGARVSPDAAGEATGQALQQGGNVFQEIVHHARVKAENTADEAGFGGIEAAYGSNIADPKTGYLGKMGADAAPLPGTKLAPGALPPAEEALKKFSAEVDQIMASLPDDDARLRLGWRAEKAKQSARLAVYSHERQQQQAVGAAVHAGTQDQLVNRAATVAANPNASMDELRSPLTDIIENARLRAEGLYGQNAPNDAIKAVALPDLQRAAVAAMSSAVNAPGVGPQRAKQLFDLYGDLLGPHRGHFDAVVSQMQGDQGVAQQAQGALSAALTPVMLPGPGGVSVPRIDYEKLGEAMKGLSPEAAKLVEQQQANYERVWRQNVAQVVDDARTEGQLPDGSFSLSRVSADKRVWLQAHGGSANGTGPDALTALKGLEDREDARARAADRADARELFNQQRDDSSAAASLVSAQIVDKDHRDKVLKTTPEEFQVQLMKGRDLDGDPLPAPLMQKHLAAVVKTYRQAQKDAAANQLDEKPEATVKAAIARAADDDPDTIKDMNARYFSSLAEKAKALIASKKGSVTTEDLAKYIDRELATGTVKGSGIIFDDSARRIESETLPKYRGKQFVPAVEELGAEAIPPQPTMASVVAPAPKTVRGYKYTSDRKQRSPVFSDGSQGPLEASP